MQHNWQAINEILRVKVNGAGILDSQYSFDTYIEQIGLLQRDGVLSVDAQALNKISSLRDFEVLLRDYCRLKDKAYRLYDLMQCDIFDSVVASLERHQAEATTDLVLETVTYALKRAVVNELNV